MRDRRRRRRVGGPTIERGFIVDDRPMHDGMEVSRLMYRMIRSVTGGVGGRAECQESDSSNV
jgi:hypothetical protein